MVARGDIGTAARPGPLIVEEYDSTTVVPPGWSACQESSGNLLLSRTGG